MRPKLTEQSECKFVAELAPTPIISVWRAIKVYYIYLLKSSKDKELYTGYTNNLERRLEEHNKGLVASTKIRKPLELVYFEGYKSELDARKRENSLKLRSRAFAQLKKRIKLSLS